jgi:hypothetical protein
MSSFLRGGNLRANLDVRPGISIEPRQTFQSTAFLLRQDGDYLLYLAIPERMPSSNPQAQATLAGHQPVDRCKSSA